MRHIVFKEKKFDMSRTCIFLNLSSHFQYEKKNKNEQKSYFFIFPFKLKLNKFVSRKHLHKQNEFIFWFLFILILSWNHFEKNFLKSMWWIVICNDQIRIITGHCFFFLQIVHACTNFVITDYSFQLFLDMSMYCLCICFKLLTIGKSQKT